MDTSRRVVCRAVAVAGLIIANSAVFTPAAEIALTGVADDDTRWFEYFSDVFVELGRDPDGFYLTSQLPNYAPIGQAGGVDAFPNNENFDLGTLTYDDSALTGSGVESATITGYAVEFDLNIADDEAVANTVENQGYATTISDLSGAIEFTGGVVTSIDFIATITFTYDFTGFSLGMLDYVGTLAFEGDRFELAVDDTQVAGAGNTELRYAWESGGVVDQVVDVPTLLGDYNGSGFVDGVDYALWRNQYGSPGPEADGNGDGVVNAADFTIWRDNYGAGSAQQLAGASVPEPATAVTCILAAGCCSLLARQRSRTRYQPSN